MKKAIIFIFLVLTVLICIPRILEAGTTHGVIGYVDNATDGTNANGATVTFGFSRGGINYCNLTDTVGISGNSEQPNWYAQDVGNCATQWQVDDLVNISIIKDANHNATTFLVLTESGGDQAPDTQLSSGGNPPSPLPTATAYQPAQGSKQTSNSVTFQLKCTDSSGVSTLRLYGNFSGSWGLNQTNSSPINNSYWSKVIDLPNGVYKWAAWCNDSDGNGDWSENITFTVEYNSGGGGGGGDVEGNITNQCGDSVCNKTSGEFSFTCNAWHESQAINNVTLYGNWLGGWHISQIKKLTSGLNNVSVEFLEEIYAGVYSWDCYACTMSGCFFVNNNNFTLNAEIEGSESEVNCCSDCGCLEGSSCENNTCEQIASCGDGTCGSGETQANCCSDCTCPINYTCTLMGCLSKKKPLNCGDGFCNISIENIINCPEDCIKKIATTTQITAGTCGDKICGNGESQTNCCLDCNCPENQKCVNNKCAKSTFFGWLTKILPWWGWLILLVLLAIAIILYFILRGITKKKSLMWLMRNIEKEIDKKKFNETQKKTRGKKMDYEKQNKKIEEYAKLGLKICNKMLKEAIEKEEIQALKEYIEKKKSLLHQAITLFDDYKKIVRKERLAFEEDLKDILFSEEIPKYAELKKEVTNLDSAIKQIKTLKATSFKGIRN